MVQHLHQRYMLAYSTRAQTSLDTASSKILSHSAQLSSSPTTFPSRRIARVLRKSSTCDAQIERSKTLVEAKNGTEKKSPHPPRYSQSQQPCDVGMHAYFVALLSFALHPTSATGARAPGETSPPIPHHPPRVRPPTRATPPCRTPLLPAPPALHGPSDRHPRCRQAHVPLRRIRSSHVAPPRQATLDRGGHLRRCLRLAFAGQVTWSPSLIL
jgi:hypothetical protein